MSKLLLIAALLFSSNSFADDYVKPTNKFISTTNGILINTDSISFYDGTTLILVDGTKVVIKDDATAVYNDIYATTKDYEPNEYSK